MKQKQEPVSIRDIEEDSEFEKTHFLGRKLKAQEVKEDLSEKGFHDLSCFDDVWKVMPVSKVFSSFKNDLQTTESKLREIRARGIK